MLISLLSSVIIHCSTLREKRDAVREYLCACALCSLRTSEKTRVQNGTDAAGVVGHMVGPRLQACACVTLVALCQTLLLVRFHGAASESTVSLAAATLLQQHQRQLQQRLLLLSYATALLRWRAAHTADFAPELARWWLSEDAFQLAVAARLARPQPWLEAHEVD